EMVADEHRLTGRPRLSDSACAVGEHHDLRPRSGGSADAVDDTANTVTLVVVGARADDEHVLAAGRAHTANRADVPLQSRLGETCDLGRVDGRRGLADQISGPAPSAAESEGDVMLLHA